MPSRFANKIVSQLLLFSDVVFEGGDEGHGDGHGLFVRDHPAVLVKNDEAW